MGGSYGIPWIELVRRTRPAVAAAPPGRLMHIREKMAHKFGFSEHALRRALATAKKIPKIAKVSGLSIRSISRFPMQSVETLGRWVEYDPKETGRQARLVRDGKTVRRLLADEHKARKRAGVSEHGSGLMLISQRMAKAFTLARWPKLTDLPKADAVDLNYVSARGRTALLVFRPRWPVAYIGEYVHRLLGLSLLYSVTIAAVPSRRAPLIRKYLRSCLRAAARASGRRHKPSMTFITLSISHPSTPIREPSRRRLGGVIIR